MKILCILLIVFYSSFLKSSDEPIRKQRQEIVSELIVLIGIQEIVEKKECFDDVNLDKS